MRLPLELWLMKLSMAGQILTRVWKKKRFIFLHLRLGTCTKILENCNSETDINIGLLCTQTSPLLRPSMSRVVGMLSGDIEVATVTSKPGYLTDWKFDDVSSVTSLTIDVSAKGTE